MSDVNAQIFDPDNYLYESHRSPGLQAVKPSFEVVETPPPLATRDSSLEPSEDEEDGAPGGSKPPRDQSRPPQGDNVLIRQLGPNYPDVANHALKYYLGPDSREQEGDHSMTVDEDIRNGVDANAAEPGHDANQRMGDTGVEEDDDFDLIETLHRSAQESADGSPTADGSQSKSLPPALHGAPTKMTLDTPSPNEKYNLKPPPLRPPPIVTSGSGKFVASPEPVDRDSLAQSPTLARFTIHREDGDPSNTLPAMQMSPPRSSSKGSPEPKPTIPSLTSALSDAGTPFSAPSPNLPRVSSGQISQYGPSPHSAMSPPSLPSHPSFWRTNTREGSISTSTPSDVAIVSATGSISTPASSLIHPSPATSHPTPTIASPDAMRPDGSVEYRRSPESECYDINGIGGPFAHGNHKCTVPDCTAAPFQTQYLLNSHMNVHSDTRPHFCPVHGCARGPGGQGFKRKNEMIRHGLVHTSPGYMCPFCTDQQHKYPRPDNLQRHVRVHHVDKDRDDAELREVLAQRPEGGSRGRRRRLGS